MDADKINTYVATLRAGAEYNHRWCNDTPADAVYTVIKGRLRPDIASSFRAALAGSTTLDDALQRLAAHMIATMPAAK